MASSSRISRTKYDVFISFRGEDVRSGFLSHLTEKLQQKKIDVYVDDRLERGDEIWPSLVDAIEQSLMSLIIFSKDYASSKWCLKELLKIMECKDTQRHNVFPIFYHTEPTHVRHQTESYEKAFAEHHKNYKEEEVQSWRSELTKAANLSGFHASHYKNEAELVEQVAKYLSTKLNPIYPRDSRNNLVGIHEKVAELETLMQQGSQDVRLIGIWGMGGIGKTTLATEVYHRFCDDYEGYYFQANVREESYKQGIVPLKKQIYERLLNEKDSNVCTLIGLPSHIVKKLGRTKVFLVLDDINDPDQLKSLVGEPNGFGVGSRIIVTTRDKVVLNGKVDNHNIYKVKLLEFDESLELFNLNASKENCLDLEWNELIKSVIKYAKGLPLALEVLGSFLRGKSKENWKSQMKKLETMSFKKIQDVLRLSYDSLDRQQKIIFLYIACFFKRYKQSDIIALLDACGFSTSIELTVLQDKALITRSFKRPNIWYEFRDIGREDRATWYISMHDLIEEMGREIVREESMENLGKRRHLWDPDDAYKVLQNNMGTASIESIILKQSQNFSLNPQVFAKMHNLKFLNLSHVDLRKDLEYLPNELRVLHWSFYPLKSLPSTFCTINLVQLIMPFSNLKKLWDGVMPLGNLKKIDLGFCSYLMELPDLSTAKNLEEVTLRCSKLKKLWGGVMPLGNLKKIDLGSCKYLMEFPDFSTVKNLEEVRLEGSNLKKLWDGVMPLGNLKIIDLSFCKYLMEFPDFSTAKNLKEVRLVGSNLKKLWHGTMPLGNLKKIDLSNCKYLMELPDFSTAKNLEEVKLSKCVDLCRVHPSILSLPKLEKLILSNCEKLTSLGSNVHSKTLRLLNLDGCEGLEEFSVTSENMIGLDLSYTAIKELPLSFASQKNLESLILDWCESLMQLPSNFVDLQSLSLLNISSCKKLQHLPKLPLSIKEVYATDCTSLRTVQLDPLHRNIAHLGFRNCMELDEDSCTALELLTRRSLRNFASFFNPSLIYPGSKVPNWFEYRTAQGSITMTIDPHSKFLGFIFCTIVRMHYESCVECLLENNDGEILFVDNFDITPENEIRLDFDITPENEIRLDLDHVYICYEECSEIINRVKESKGSNQNNLKFSFEFWEYIDFKCIKKVRVWDVSNICQARG